MYAEILQDLNTVFVPHDGQKPIGKALFYEGKRRVFLECGRKFGKTEMMLYFLYRMMLTIKGAACYYFAPFQKEAREIIWASRRIQTFMPKALRNKYGITHNDTETRVRCAYSGGFIKLDGSDNFASHAGTNPHAVGYDEFKDFKREFYGVMDPNLATFDAPLLIIGTPPETESNQFCEVAADIQIDPTGAYFNMPSWANPHVPRKFLKRKKAELFRAGREDEWYREYEAKRVKGGAKAIYPMFSRPKHIMQHADIIREIAKDKKRMIWQAIADPSGASVFGVLFRAIHPYTKVIYRLDEIYEKRPSHMTSRRIWDQVRAKIMDLYPEIEEWELIYDEAATWFSNEMAEIFEEEGVNNAFYPSEKHIRRSNKEYGINLIREQMLTDRYFMSDRCTSLASEIENYVKDDKGRIPKENDHLLDCDRYGDQVQGHSLNRVAYPEDKTNDDRRMITMEEDIKMWQEEKDWTIAYDNCW